MFRLHATFEVPDPDEAVDYTQRRYRIILRSTMGPIDVYLVSQFEEKFEEMSSVEPSMSFPIALSSGSNENPATEITTVGSIAVEIEPQAQDSHQLSSDLNVSQDYTGGIMKILPSDIDNDADYWLLSDADVSITDMWKTNGRICSKNWPSSAALSFSDEQKKENIGMDIRCMMKFEISIARSSPLFSYAPPKASMFFKKLCLNFDALSHFHFTPKPVVEDMSIQANVPALAMEEVDCTYGSIRCSYASS